MGLEETVSECSDKKQRILVVDGERLDPAILERLAVAEVKVPLLPSATRCTACGAKEGEPCRGNCERAIPSSTAPHDRGALIERVAKALCQHAYPARTLDEAVAPSRQLWMRLIPEAEIAVQAMESARSATGYSELSSLADQLEMAYGDMPKDRPPGPPTTIVQKLRELASARPATVDTTGLLRRAAQVIRDGEGDPEFTPHSVSELLSQIDSVLAASDGGGDK
jgi:hypothetical protein